MNYIVNEELPSPEEYCELRKLGGMSPKTIEAATKGLPRSLYSITIRDSGKIIAMGRAIGDVGCHVQIVDIVVRPEYQGQKLSKIIMDHVMGFVKRECYPCTFVNLFADVGFLYQKYGFINSVKSQGMYLDWNLVK